MKRRRWWRWALGFAALGVVGCGQQESLGPDGEPLPNIVLITLDTTRADHLGLYGAAAATTPHLDALATESVVYDQAYSTSSWTLPAHASLFSGRFPSSHGSRYDVRGPVKLTSAIEGPEAWNLYRARGMGDGYPTLAELLTEAGYATGAVVAGPWMKRVFGFGRGFQHYDDANITTLQGRLGESVTTDALDWVGSTSGQPFFLFLNYYDPHTPYAPPAAFVNRYVPAELRNDPARAAELELALYDAEITYMDQQFGRLREGLRERGVERDTWFIITADHGELFGEHGYRGHGHHLTQEELHIPLIVRWPREERAASRVAHRVQILDIFAMILARTGIPLPPRVQASHPDRVTHPVVAEVYPLPYRTQEGSWRVLLEGDFKLHQNSKGDHRLFNLRLDPREADNLVMKEAAVAQRMGVTLARYLDGLPPPPVQDEAPVALDPATEAALRSLGYTN